LIGGARGASLPVFPYVPINQLLSIAPVTPAANELENCQSAPITIHASARESQ